MRSSLPICSHRWKISVPGPRTHLPIVNICRHYILLPMGRGFGYESEPKDDPDENREFIAPYSTAHHFPRPHLDPVK